MARYIFSVKRIKGIDGVLDCGKMGPSEAMEACMIVAKFSTLAGGVFIEENGTDSRKAFDRCFRFDKNGNAEYALLADLQSNNPAPRWFGHCYKADNFILA